MRRLSARLAHRIEPLCPEPAGGKRLLPKPSYRPTVVVSLDVELLYRPNTGTRLQSKLALYFHCSTDTVIACNVLHAVSSVSVYLNAILREGRTPGTAAGRGGGIYARSSST